MSNNANTSSTTTPKRSTPLSFIGKLFRLISNMMWISLLTWGLLLAVTAISIVFIGWQSTTYHLHELVMSMTTHAWGDEQLVLWLQQPNSNIALPSWLAWAFPNPAPLEHSLHAMTKITSILLLVTQFVVLRCQLFLVGSLLIIAFGLLGLMDGLIQRDIRKYRAARESTLFFHRSKAFLSTIFYTGYFLFISIPVTFNLTLGLLLLAMLMGFMIYLASKNFKKYV